MFTNNLRVSQVGNQAEYDGTWLIAGRSVLLQSTNGFYTNTFNPGNYKVEVLPANNYPRADINQLQPLIFAVPNDTNTYYISQLLLSGYNTFNYTPGVLGLTSSNGTVQFNPSNGKGFVDLAVIGGTGSGGSGNAITLYNVTQAAWENVSLQGLPGFETLTIGPSLSTNGESLFLTNTTQSRWESVQLGGTSGHEYLIIGP